ncbi:MAG: 4-alpha-glucanotransferase, partial [Clostridiales bacterium]|nr:4-alpha-glucanotransferase [Clostridiales bacterium]
MRSSGILMHISSLPSPYGIGTMGEAARRFADFLKKSGQKYWQMLPICPTSYGDSPYQSFSSFAGNPYFIDLEYLCRDGLLTKSECESFFWGKDAQRVDYDAIYRARYALLKKAYPRFFKNEPKDYAQFCMEEEEWLEDYALFMALKDAGNGVAWFEWKQDLKRRNPKALDEARKT